MRRIANTACGLACAGLLMGSLLGPGVARGEDAADRDALRAPESVQVGEAILSLETEIWAAGQAGNGGRMPATVVLRMRTGGEAVPVGLKLDALWYVNGSAVSPAVELGAILDAPDGELIRESAEVIDSDGDGVVDVVIGVRDAAGRLHLIKAPAQPLREL
jgi:hypothetical protein